MTVASGTATAALDLGEHVCYVYDSDEEHALVVTEFVRRGLEAGDKILYLADGHTEAAILNLLLRAGMDPDPLLATGQLTVSSAIAGYVPNGVFEPDAMIDMLNREIELASSQGYRGLRATGELTWSLKGYPGSDRTLEYEEALSAVYPGRPALGLCQYDRRMFRPTDLSETRGVHPSLLIGSLLHATRQSAPGAFRFHGQIDASNATILAETIASEGHDSQGIHLDLADVDFIDASGMRALFRAAQQMGGPERVAFDGMHPTVQRMMSLFGWNMN